MPEQSSSAQEKDAVECQRETMKPGLRQSELDKISICCSYPTCFSTRSSRKGASIKHSEKEIRDENSGIGLRQIQECGVCMRARLGLSICDDTDEGAGSA